MGPISSQRLVGIAAGALVLAVFGCWSAIFLIYGVDVPLQDQWDTPLGVLILNREGQLTLADLARQHNEARKLVPNVVSIAVTYLAGHYDTRAELFASLVVFVATLIPLVIATRSATSWTASAAIASWLTALAWSAHTSRLHLNSITFERLLPEFALAAALSILVLRGVTWPGTLTAGALAAIAQYSFAGGAVVWALLVAYIAVMSPVKPERVGPKIAFLVTAAVLSSTLYFHDYQAPSQHSSPFAVLGEPPWRIVGFLLAFLGNAFTRNLVTGGVLGAVGTGAYVWLVWRFATRPSPLATRRVEALWILLGAYSLLQGVIVTVGRLAMDFDHATRPDYVMHAVYLYAAVAALSLLRAPDERRREAGSLVVLFAAMAWAATLFGDRFWSDMERRQQARRHGKACVLLHRLHGDEACLRMLYTPSGIATRIESAGPLLQPLPVDRLDIGDAGQGWIETIRAEAARTTASGWAVRDGAPADAVILTWAPGGAETERIVSIVAVDEPRPDVAAQVSIRGERAGWQAEIPASSPIDPCRLRAYVFDTDDGRLHPIGARETACRSAPEP